MTARSIARSSRTVSLHDAHRRPLVRRRVIEKRYQVCAKTLFNWMRKGWIPYYKIGGLLLFSIEEVDQALQKHKVRAV